MATDTQDLHRDVKLAMDRMYRITRHVYDASRKYYLLGRDRMIRQLGVRDGELICEVGCGTARNLIKMADLYSRGKYYGLDASEEMLKTASASLHKNHFEDEITLAQAYAQDFDPQSLFGLSKPFDKIVFSYALSIIPPWRESFDHALKMLAAGGQMHIVDFGSMDGQPEWFRKLIFWWLSLFHVYHKPEIMAYLQTLEADGRARVWIETLYRGYSYIAVITKI